MLKGRRFAEDARLIPCASATSTVAERRGGGPHCMHPLNIRPLLATSLESWTGHSSAKNFALLCTE